MNIYQLNNTKLWPAFDKFMRLGGHNKVGQGVYKRGSKVYQFLPTGDMNSNMESRWKIFLRKWLDGGIEYLDTLN